MNADSASWIVGVLAAAVVGVLIRAVATLFGRVRETERKIGIVELSGADVKGLRDDVHALHVCVERDFVRRDQWVPVMSRIEGMLESQSKALIRLEERQKTHGD